VERMAREVETEALLLVLQALALAPGGDGLELHAFRCPSRAAEEARLRRELLALLGRLDGVAEGREQCRAIGLEGIERAGADECFHRAAVHHAAIDPAAEVG